MSAKRKSFKVRIGNSHLTVSPWTHPGTGAERWRFAYRPTPGAPWRYRSCKTKTEAEAEAIAKLEALQSGTNTLDELTPERRRWLEEIHRSVSIEDQPRVSAFIAAMHKSGEITGAVQRFMAAKISKAGEETPHLATARSVLEACARHFHGRNVSDIHQPDLAAWFAIRTSGLGWKRKKDIRGTLVQFWIWARKQGIAGTDPDTAAERLAEIGTETRGERLILTRKQFKQLEQHIRPEWRAWLVLGCFAGMRPEEIVPGHEKKSNKRGLRCEEIDFRFKSIRLPACVSKGGKRPRNIPMTDTLIAFLEWADIRPGMTGPVCIENPTRKGELNRLAKKVFGLEQWPHNICRHSYASYRNAGLRNLYTMAEEMGTSKTMLDWHYHNPQPEELGTQWFAMRPGVPICSDETQVEASTTKSASR